MLTKETLTQALRGFTIEKNAVLLVHSSLKSLGQIDGGAETVIKALRETVCDGTLVMPTLSSKNWETVFQDWSIDRPSDTGLITETFRLQENSYRSDNETHSVAASGVFAQDLTSGKKNAGARYGIFGDYCFSTQSAWQRMYDSRTRYGVKAYVLFWGVSMLYNTFKHFAEYRFVEELLTNIKDKNTRAELKAELSHYPFSPTAQPWELVWPFYDSFAYQDELLKRGILKKIQVGKGEILCADVFDSVNAVEKDLRERSKEMLYEKAYAWVEKARNAGK